MANPENLPKHVNDNAERIEKFLLPNFVPEAKNFMRISHEAGTALIDDYMVEQVSAGKAADYPANTRFPRMKLYAHELLLELKRLSESPETTKQHYHEVYNSIFNLALSNPVELQQRERSAND